MSQSDQPGLPKRLHLKFRALASSFITVRVQTKDEMKRSTRGESLLETCGGVWGKSSDLWIFLKEEGNTKCAVSVLKASK